MPKGKANRLIGEKSPYLLQHAHNPVDWHPWGAEAFEKAKREDKPVFLSIGYSTCHWCHVMERESFEDEDVARLLNAFFICIKVDREERPDVDSVYMSACQAMTGQGGWPLTVFMTPEQEPFYTATYIPKTFRYGTAGMLEILPRIAAMWKSERQKITEAGKSVKDYLMERQTQSAEGNFAAEELLDGAFRYYKSNFDAANGGFSAAPKFPSAHNLLFLMRLYEAEGKDTLGMVEKTLTQLYRGGIFDHVGGGFSRYSTDSRWLVPHFEKMLYDNALLMMAYTEAYKLTKNPVYKRAALKTGDYVLKEMTGEKGEFFCAQDADSEGEEGRYYVFTPGEVKSVLGEEGGARFCEWFDITERGNFEGKSIPNLLKNEAFEKENPEIESLLEKLYKYRLTRTRLHKDDKALLSWNALMIAAFAGAYSVFKKEEYIKAARFAGEFIESKLTREGGRLFVRYRENHSAGEGTLDDYAFYAWALLALYDATLEAAYLKRSAEVASLMRSLFFDERDGGFYLYASDAERLIVRPKELYDGATPSGNSAALLVLGRLFSLTAQPVWGELFDKQLSFVLNKIGNFPAAGSFAMFSVLRAAHPSKTLVCVSPGEEEKEALLEFISDEPGGVDALLKTRKNSAVLEEAAPFIKEYPFPKEKAAYYICENGACRAPVSSLSELRL